MRSHNSGVTQVGSDKMHEGEPTGNHNFTSIADSTPTHDVKEENSTVDQRTPTPPSTRHYVVVFDIDGTLCKSRLNETGEYESGKNDNPECPLINYMPEPTELKYEMGAMNWRHLFLPYLHILFDYLLEQGVRLVFFSSCDNERRNEFLISELLKVFWGNWKYESLKSRGQFEVFSMGDIERANRQFTDEHGCKNLQIVVRNGESLLDAILVEDSQCWVARNQEPHIHVPDIDYAAWTWTNEDTKRRICNVSKNNIYLSLIHI